MSEVRPLSEFSIEERIVGWRKSARQAARLSEATDDPVMVACHASMAAMYFALAADAERFGELPDIDDEEGGE